jgi:cytochrome c556
MRSRRWKLAVALALAATLAAVAISAGAQTTTQDPQQPGWTGLTAPHEVIAARQALMLDLERLMRPLDAYAVEETGDAEALRAAAESIAAMLAATPHLYPPTTDLYDPAAEQPATLALPAIWQQFDAFHAMAGAAVDTAIAVTQAEGAALASSARALRTACDACHAVYLRPYAPPRATEEDLSVDFDALFGPP